MRSRIAGLAFLALMMVAPAGPAAADIERRAASDFHRRALIEGDVAPGEAHAVPLSREAVAALKKGGELRLFDGAGREIPSLVYSADSRSEVIERPVTIYNRAWEARGTQTLSVELTDRKPEPVNEFVFHIEEEDYNLRVRVEGSPDGDAWQILRDGLHLIRHTVKKEKICYVHNVLRVPTARFRHYRFTLEPMVAPDDDDEPLEIEGVDVRQVVKRGSSLAVPVRLEPFEDTARLDTRHDFWTLDLGREDLGVDHVELTIPADDFARSASLWEWSEERGRRTRRLASTVVFHYDDDVHTGLHRFLDRRRHAGPDDRSGGRRAGAGDRRARESPATTAALPGAAGGKASARAALRPGRAARTPLRPGASAPRARDRELHGAFSRLARAEPGLCAPATAPLGTHPVSSLRAGDSAGRGPWVVRRADDPAGRS